jgi:hypothetical protein
MTHCETCGRCGREVSIDADEFIYGEAIGEEWICESCVTPEEQQAADEDDMAIIGALDDAGLGGDSDLGAMGETEYEMREQLASVFYDQDSPP